MSGMTLGAGSVSLRLYASEGTSVDQVNQMRAEAQLAEDIGYDGVNIMQDFRDTYPTRFSSVRFFWQRLRKYGFLLVRCYSRPNLVPCLQKK